MAAPAVAHQQRKRSPAFSHERSAALLLVPRDEVVRRDAGDRLPDNFQRDIVEAFEAETPFHGRADHTGQRCVRGSCDAPSDHEAGPATDRTVAAVTVFVTRITNLGGQLVTNPDNGGYKNVIRAGSSR